MKSLHPFFQRKHVITGLLLTFIFTLLIQITPQLFIHYIAIYDEAVILLKAAELAKALTWPLSSLLSSQVITSYFFLPFVFLYYLTIVVFINGIHLFLTKKKLYRWLFAIALLAFIILRSNPNLLTHLDNHQSSLSIGTSGNGSLQNGKRLVFKGKNFQYFNFISYLKGNCYVHEKVKQTLLDAYKTCETTCPGILFHTGEGSLKHGGTYIINHRTHQNGTSVDLLLVFKKNNAPYDPINLFNAYGYGLDTDNNGYIDKSKPINFYPSHTQVDFETNARFLLALDDACQKNGIHIKIVVLKVELIPLLLATPSGKKLQARNMHFVKSLPPFVNQAHDDHFHVDFEVPQ